VRRPPGIPPPEPAIVRLVDEQVGAAASAREGEGAAEVALGRLEADGGGEAEGRARAGRDLEDERLGARRQIEGPPGGAEGEQAVLEPFRTRKTLLCRASASSR
jgi:hypothetical protein